MFILFQFYLFISIFYYFVFVRRKNYCINNLAYKNALLEMALCRTLVMSCACMYLSLSLSFTQYYVFSKDDLMIFGFDFFYYLIKWFLSLSPSLSLTLSVKIYSCLNCQLLFILFLK
jgi:hypothetical protein